MSETLVKTSCGMVEGITDGKVSIWRGIPYAAAPVKSLRFRAPQPPGSWEGVRAAKAFSPAAIQSTSPSMLFLGDTPEEKDEDCLYLNIWSPGADDKRRPVMVWIHGGSFNYGSGSAPMYDGKSFAERGDVVVVTVNYRLGVFGFLDLSQMDDQAYSHSVNYGLLDQVAALKWVTENIEAFGGDPTNVTIFGESAGAVSVGNLLAMPSAKGLFQKAILQSGTGRANVTRKRAAEMTEQLLAELKVDPENLSALETIPAETIMNAIKIFPRNAFGPVGDGTVLPERPELALNEGFAKDIPVMVGTNKDESLLFTYFDPTWENVDDSQLENIFKLTYQSLWPNISKYLVQGEALTRDLYEDILTHYVFTFPAIFFGGSQAKHGAPVWMYRFDYESTVLDGRLKAFHALEIPFAWNNLLNYQSENLGGSDPQRFTLANQMHSAWIAFAHHGNPNTPELPDWPTYDLENRATMVFNTTNEVVNDPDSQKRLNWEQVFKS